MATLSDSETAVTTQSYLFNTGRGFQSQDYLGCHWEEDDQVSFRVWAPQAQAVAVVGTFNDWQPTALSLVGTTGIWQGRLSQVQAGDLYKFQITSQSGEKQLKIDPFAQQFERKPGDAAVVLKPVERQWHDSLWLARRKKSHPENRPICLILAS